MASTRKCWGEDFDSTAKVEEPLYGAYAQKVLWRLKKLKTAKVVSKVNQTLSSDGWPKHESVMGKIYGLNCESGRAIVRSLYSKVRQKT